MSILYLTFLLIVVFLTVSYVGYFVIPTVYHWMSVQNVKRVHKYSTDIEQLMSRQQARKISRMLTLVPFAAAAVFFIFSPEGFQIQAAGLGLILGFIFPRIYISFMRQKIQRKFNDQLVDALMIMSSSFRGGLSLIQALEAVVDEMPNPINKEFGMVLGENKMGVSLEESLYHLYNRMPSVAVQQMITAILLARETGGNLPAIFNRIVTNIRENKKIQQNIDTLTIQGKIQGVVMTLLPIAFGCIVYSANKRIFENMFTSELGRGLLIYAVISELIGAIMIWKISSYKEF